MKRILLLLLASILVAAGLFWALLPDVQPLADHPPASTRFMKLRQKELRNAGKNDRLQHQWVSYERISPYLRRAVLVAEDDTFYEHEGVDVESLKSALRKDWKEKKLRHGGSTITQQLAKNLYLSPSRNPIRKLREFLIARRLERELTKKRILEIYLNVAEMGERVYGAEAAARFYFQKPASALSASEAALLAGSLPNPRIMNPAKPNKRLRNRQRMILSRMRRWGHLAEIETLRGNSRKDSPDPQAPPGPLPPAPVEPQVPEPDENPTPPPHPETPPVDPPAEEPPPTNPQQPPAPEPAATPPSAGA